MNRLIWPSPTRNIKSEAWRDRLPLNREEDGHPPKGGHGDTISNAALRELPRKSEGRVPLANVQQKRLLKGYRTEGCNPRKVFSARGTDRVQHGGTKSEQDLNQKATHPASGQNKLRRKDKKAGLSVRSFICRSSVDYSLSKRILRSGMRRRNRGCDKLY